jgi:gamma-glutamyltranspeptidase
MAIRRAAMSLPTADRPTYVAGRTFYHYPVTVTLAAAYALPAAHQLELKLVASNAYQSSMLVAHETTTYASFPRIR